MKILQLIALFMTVCLPFTAKAADVAQGCYELRIYHAAEGKLGALHARFRDHTTQLFARHGMTNVAYWVPLENAGQRLVYLLAYPDAAAREASWTAFAADPEWIAAKAASETSGPLVAKVESRLLTPTAFSPAFAEIPAGGTFEMRTYTTTPGNLPRLLDRFKNHTIGLFSKHGMRHFGYFTPLLGTPGDDNTLIYFLRHDSAQACAASFAAFRADPDWVAARSASEAAAGGSLTVADGVKSELLTVTDYSPQ